MKKKIIGLFVGMLLALALTVQPANAAGVTVVLSLWNGSSWLNLGDVSGTTVDLLGNTKYRFVVSGPDAPYSNVNISAEHGQINFTLWTSTSFSHVCSGCSAVFQHPTVYRVTGNGGANTITSATFIGTTTHECTSEDLVGYVSKNGVSLGVEATHYIIGCGD